MIETIKNNLIFPLLTRLGTATGALLASFGMHEGAADQVALGFTALALFGVDLVASYLNRKRERR